MSSIYQVVRSHYTFSETLRLQWKRFEIAGDKQEPTMEEQKHAKNTSDQDTDISILIRQHQKLFDSRTTETPKFFKETSAYGYFGPVITLPSLAAVENECA